MVDLVTASMLLSSVANTGKLIEYAMAIGETVLRPTVAEARKEAENFTKSRLAQANIEQLAKSITITDKILEKIREVIDDAGVDIIDTIDKFDKLPPDVADNRLKAARRKFCWGLHQYKFHNGGGLPSDMENDWMKNMCYSYNFV